MGAEGRDALFDNFKFFEAITQERLREAFTCSVSQMQEGTKVEERAQDRAHNTQLTTLRVVFNDVTQAFASDPTPAPVLLISALKSTTFCFIFAHMATPSVR